MTQTPGRGNERPVGESCVDKEVLKGALSLAGRKDSANRAEAVMLTGGTASTGSHKRCGGLQRDSGGEVERDLEWWHKVGDKLKDSRDSYAHPWEYLLEHTS